MLDLDGLGVHRGDVEVRSGLHGHVDGGASATQGARVPDGRSLCLVGGRSPMDGQSGAVQHVVLARGWAARWCDTSPAIAGAVSSRGGRWQWWRARARQFFWWAMPCLTRMGREECALRCWGASPPTTPEGSS